MITPFATFKAKFGLVFVLTQEENAWSFQTLGFVLKPRERARILRKNGTRDFQISPPFERSACFYMTTTESFECFHYFYFNQFSEKRKPFSKKLQHRFLFESTKIESATFPHETALPEANVKTNRMRQVRVKLLLKKVNEIIQK